MSQCPIYTASEIAERVEVEIAQLLDSFRAKLQHKAIKLDKKQPKYEEDESPDHLSVWYWSYLFQDAKIGKSQKRRSIALHFDMYRKPDASTSELSYIRDAILVVAYSPSSPNSWTPDELAIGGDGFPAARNDLTAHPLDRHILVFKEDVENPSSWADKYWLYATPLLSIDTPDALNREIANPIESLLIDNKAEGALADTHAILWPEFSENGT